jgi:hypothetical protein
MILYEDYPFVINIPRPYPETGENEQIIKYIEPLRESGLVRVSSAYWFNLDQYKKGEECSLSPGFKYMFWFKTEQDMIWLKQHFGVEE